MLVHKPNIGKQACVSVFWSYKYVSLLYVPLLLIMKGQPRQSEVCCTCQGKGVRIHMCLSGILINGQAS